jgi:HK97 gp10 family phage protein
MASRGATVQILYNHIPRIAAALRPACGEIVQETILAIETGAKIVVPVDTGALRASIESDMTGDTSGEVATAIEYSVYVEYGTVHMAARPYMTPAAEAERRHFMRKMSDLEARLE